MEGGDSARGIKTVVKLSSAVTVPAPAASSSGGSAPPAAEATATSRGAGGGVEVLFDELRQRIFARMPLFGRRDPAKKPKKDDKTPTIEDKYTLKEQLGT